MTQVIGPDADWAALELQFAPAPTITDPYDEAANAETFDLVGYMAQFEPALFTRPEGRRTLTRYDPMLFAIVYFGHHLRTGGQVSFADPHFDWVRVARGWSVKNDRLRDDRHVFVAPRDCGKSTWWFLILPMWAAAHGHKKFAVAFAHSGIQSETHLHAFRSELAENELLREDYPTLCTPARKPNGKTTADNIQMLRTKMGFAFAARGIDAANLGIKEKDTRPDLMILDDIEPDEATYSIYQMGKRRGTMLEAILPMNLRASVVLVGTVTMPGSVIHQCVEVAQGTDDPEKWIVEELFRVHYAHPIPLRPDGSERSIWPVKWPLSFLQQVRHTRTALKNFWNSPMGVDGGYWTVDDFTHEILPNCTQWMMGVDPSITTKTTSDFAGISVIAYAPGYVIDHGKGRLPTRVPSRCQVEYARAFKLVGEDLRKQVLLVLQSFPRIRLIVVEGNQGGENWHAILHDLPPGVRLKVVWSKKPKEVRAADLLELYQHNPPRVVHGRRLPELEQQMAAFPKVHDDLIDSVGSICLRVLGPKPPKNSTQFPV